MLKIVGSVLLPGLAIRIKGFEAGELKFEFCCETCGGWIIHIDDQTEAVSCKACNEPFGNLEGVRDACARLAAESGYKVER